MIDAYKHANFIYEDILPSDRLSTINRSGCSKRNRPMIYVMCPESSADKSSTQENDRLFSRKFTRVHTKERKQKRIVLRMLSSVNLYSILITHMRVDSKFRIVTFILECAQQFLHLYQFPFEIILIARRIV